MEFIDCSAQHSAGLLCGAVNVSDSFVDPILWQ